jgi:hypothetical protein
MLGQIFARSSEAAEREQKLYNQYRIDQCLGSASLSLASVFRCYHEVKVVLD